MSNEDLIKELNGYITAYNSNEDKVQAATQLSEKLNENRPTYNFSRYSNFKTNGNSWLRLMSAIRDAFDESNTENVKMIADIAKTLIEKCDRASLIAGFTAKEKSENELDNKTAWKVLMAALTLNTDDTYTYTTENFKVIAGIAKTFFEKCDPTPIERGSPEIIPYAWSWLERMGSNATPINSTEIAALIIQIVVKLDNASIMISSKEEKSIRDYIHAEKPKLSAPLRDYLSNKAQELSVDEFEKMCSGRLLGPLIDFQSGLFYLDSEKTGTRKHVDKLIKAKKEKPEFIAQVILDKFSKYKHFSQPYNFLESSVEDEVKRLNPEKSKDKDAVRQLVIEVLKTDIIQKQLLPKREEALNKIAQTILDKFLKAEINLSTQDLLIDAVKQEIVKQLGIPNMLTLDDLNQYILAVLKTDIIQKQLLPERAKREEKSEKEKTERPAVSVSTGPALFSRADATPVKIVTVEEDAKSVDSRSVPSKPILPSENALKYAEIFNRHALLLYPHFDFLFDDRQSVIDILQVWKGMLRPNEIENVKKAAREDCNKVIANASDQHAQSEIERLLETVKVPQGKLELPQREVIEEPQEAETERRKENPKLSS
jgi:hypothetical protein